MSHLSDLLGAEAAPLTFDHAGKTYTITPVTQHVKTQIERWLRKLAYADLYAMREDMPADQYQDAMSTLQIDRARYAFNGQAFWRTIGTDEGSIAIVAILFQTTEADAVKLLAERKDDVDPLVQETILSGLPRTQADAMRERLRKTTQSESAPADPPAPA